jgi:hypothetical protein
MSHWSNSPQVALVLVMQKLHPLPPTSPRRALHAVTEPVSNRAVSTVALEGRATSLSLLKADENILFHGAHGIYRVGNDQFSCTLNKNSDTH